MSLYCEDCEERGERAEAEVDRLRVLLADRDRRYEELRRETDGGSETMTHADAVEAIRHWKSDRVSFVLRWWQVENPLLGGVSPLGMLRMGRGEKLAAFVEDAIAAGCEEEG